MGQAFNDYMFERIRCWVWTRTGYHLLTIGEFHHDFDLTQLHRTDGPAVEWTTGNYEWWLNGKRHRLGGPAIQTIDGNYWWYMNGQLHRVDGPAVELHKTGNTWYLYNQRIPKHPVEKWIQENSIDLSTPEGQAAFKLRWSP